MIDALSLEYNLTIASRLGCDCLTYLIRRRDVLIPAVQRRAVLRGVDPVDLFADFARTVHARHLAGESLSTAAAS